MSIKFEKKIVKVQASQSQHDWHNVVEMVFDETDIECAIKTYLDDYLDMEVDFISFGHDPVDMGFHAHIKGIERTIVLVKEEIND